MDVGLGVGYMGCRLVCFWRCGMSLILWVVIGYLLGLIFFGIVIICVLGLGDLC